MRRKEFVCSKGSKHCCEDHFNLKEDMENYMYYKTMKGSVIKLKPGVIPHIFECQKNRKSTEVVKVQSVILKKQNKSIIEDILGDSYTTENIHHEKCIQVNIKPYVRSKSIQCSFPRLCNENNFEKLPRKRTKFSKKLKVSHNGSSNESSNNSRSTTGTYTSSHTSTSTESSMLDTFVQKLK
ncbi:uncharacterized protein LOC108912063 [Anoplophora glabripennis]|uniref:uncharacterized protein LOC108912063 n=1 Tax=Anoplophora glabripennis TaxID=217634 RepID=UPI000874EC50|nr:uncharacterized protein LOC108912063 [Anoplophora glabripennis]